MMRRIYESRNLTKPIFRKNMLMKMTIKQSAE